MALSQGWDPSNYGVLCNYKGHTPMKPALAVADHAACTCIACPTLKGI